VCQNVLDLFVRFERPTDNCTVRRSNMNMDMDIDVAPRSPKGKEKADVMMMDAEKQAANMPWYF